ncbi:MAG: sigma-70 family RNA polymerase sigma factor [Pseudomonadota bacterium]
MTALRSTVQVAPAVETDADAKLMVAVAKGDERAFATLVAQNLDRVHGLAVRFTGNQADAEDIAQEAFLRVWRSADRWQPGKAKVSTWLHRIVMNLCIDRSRRAKRRRHDDLAEADQIADPTPGADRDHMGRVAVEMARQEIAALPERQRAALLLSVVTGHSNPEIGEILGMSVGAVEQALVRARRKLREKLGDKI